MREIATAPPATMPPTAKSDPNDNVAIPVTPWPMVQANAMTPPTPIKAPRVLKSVIYLALLKPSNPNVRFEVGPANPPRIMPAMTATPNEIVAPVNVIRY